MSFFDNQNCSLHELSEDELPDVTELAGGYPWKMLILDNPDLPSWLETRAKAWKYIPLISFNTDDIYFCHLFVVWDEVRAEGIMCDRWCDGVYKVADLTKLAPSEISLAIMEYIDSTGGLDWLLDDDSVEVGRTDLLLKKVVRDYLTDNVPENARANSQNGLSPDGWIENLNQ